MSNWQMRNQVFAALQEAILSGRLFMDYNALARRDASEAMARFQRRFGRRS